MRIGFNGRLLSGASLRGWNRYLVNVVEALAANVHEVFIYSQQPIHETHVKRFEHLPNVHLRVVSGSPYIVWEQISLRKAISKDRLQVFHCPSHFGVPYGLGIPTFLTIHDAIEENFYRKNFSWPQKMNVKNLKAVFYELISRRATNHFLTVSEFSKNDIHHTYGVPLDQLSVIYEAADPAFFRDQSIVNDELKASLGGFYFYVGGFDSRKNIAFLLKAFQQSTVSKSAKLVLVGSDRDIFESWQKKGLVGDAVLFLGEKNDAELKWFYENALAFIYPSFYEGFGLQLCEAMACGSPCLVASNTSLAEVCAEAGMTFNPSDLDSLIAVLETFHGDRSLQQKLKKLSAERSGFFSWDKHAIELEKVYQKFIG